MARTLRPHAIALEPFVDLAAPQHFLGRREDLVLLERVEEVPVFPFGDPPVRGHFAPNKRVIYCQAFVPRVGNDSFLRRWTVDVLSGMIAGFVALGIGSRLAMRIAGAFAPAESFGASTEAQANVGIITADGTQFLIFMGTFMGALAALAYRPLFGRLPGAGWQRGLLFGIVLLLVFGSRIIEPANPDFGLVAHPMLNTSTFAALFLLFGVAVGFVHERLDEAVGMGTSLATKISLGVTAVATIPALFVGGVFVAFELGSDAPPLYFTAMLGAVAVGAGIVWTQRRMQEKNVWRRLFPFAPACAVGAAFLMVSIWTIAT